MLVFRVQACGICGSNLHAVEAPGKLSEGIVLGQRHPLEVVKVGAGVPPWVTSDPLGALSDQATGGSALMSGLRRHPAWTQGTSTSGSIRG